MRVDNGPISHNEIGWRGNSVQRYVTQIRATNHFRCHVNVIIFVLDFVLSFGLSFVNRCLVVRATPDLLTDERKSDTWRRSRCVKLLDTASSKEMKLFERDSSNVFLKNTYHFFFDRRHFNDERRQYLLKRERKY